MEGEVKGGMDGGREFVITSFHGIVLESTLKLSFLQAFRVLGLLNCVTSLLRCLIPSLCPSVFHSLLPSLPPSLFPAQWVRSLHPDVFVALDGDNDADGPFSVPRVRRVFDYNSNYVTSNDDFCLETEHDPRSSSLCPPPRPMSPDSLLSDSNVNMPDGEGTIEH